METKKEKVLSQGARNAQGAVGDRNIVPVSTSSSISDGQNHYEIEGVGVKQIKVGESDGPRNEERMEEGEEMEMVITGEAGNGKERGDKEKGSSADAEAGIFEAIANMGKASRGKRKISSPLEMGSISTGEEGEGKAGKNADRVKTKRRTKNRRREDREREGSTQIKVVNKEGDRIVVSSSSSEEVQGRRKSKILIISSGEETDDIACEETPTEENGKGGKRKEHRRGVPYSSGAHVGMAKAKRDLARKEMEDIEKQAVEELVKEGRIRSIGTRSQVEIVESSEDAWDENRPLWKLYEAVNKGEAAEAITAAVQIISKRTETQETICQKREMDKMKKEIEALKAERDQWITERLKTQERKGKAETAEISDPPRGNTHPGGKKEEVKLKKVPEIRIQKVETLVSEELANSIMKRVGAMISARFDAIEERLLPAKVVRPQLMGNIGNREGRSKQEQNMESPGGEFRKREEISQATTYSAVCQREKLDTGDGVKPGKVDPRGRKEKPKEEWRKIGKKGKEEKEKVKEKTRVEKVSGTISEARNIRVNVAQGRRIRTPKTAAVVVSMDAKEGGMEYNNEDGSAVQRKPLGEILAEAKGKVSLESLGIESIRPKRAITGGIIYEIPGPDSQAGADKLAAKLKEVLKDQGVRVDRPTKMEEVRITGLDDDTTASEVKLAIALAGRCEEGLVRVGDVKRGPAGLGMVWARMPAVAAKLIAENKTIKVGWVKARVTVLQPRLLQCFKCLEMGHTRSKCPSTMDRSGRCYRCGQEGHRAGTCTERAHCIVCKEKGRPAGHRCAGKACPLTRIKQGRGTRQEAKDRGERGMKAAEEPARPTQNA